MSTRQFPGCTEVLGVSTTLFKNKTIRDRTSPDLPQSASSNGLRFSSEPILKKSIEGFKKPFSICQSAIQIIEKRGFPKKSRSDCSQGMETGRFVIKSNIPSRNTPRWNSLKAPAEKSLNLMAILYFMHPTSTNGVAVHRIIVIDTSALSCLTPIVITVDTSTSPHIEARRG